MHFRQLELATASGPVVLTAAGPREVAIAPFRETMVPLLAPLGLLGATLALATMFQLRFGLAPLRRLRGELADVRSGIRAIFDVEPDLAVAIDPQDFDEIVGNLLDNAGRIARSTIAVAARAREAAMELTLDDDGPGLTDAGIREALVPGRRLDERGDGHGFGLPIAQELAELNGGSLILDNATSGGLRALLRLPATS